VAPARIFTDDRRPAPGAPWAYAATFVGVIAVACAVESGRGDWLIVFFGLSAMFFGFLLGWWAVAVPVARTTVALAAGVECSISESPQALMLAGSALGVAARRLGDLAPSGR